MSAARSDAARARDLAKIHIGKKQLCGDDDEAYRDMLEAVAGQRSAADLDGAGRRKVLEHLRACGVEFHPAGQRPRPQAAPERAPLIRKIRALLADSKLPEAYAEAILRRQTGHGHRTPLEWGTPEQLRAVVAALYNDARRRRGRDTGLTAAQTAQKGVN